MFIPAIHCRVVCPLCLARQFIAGIRAPLIYPSVGFKPDGGRVVVVAVPGILMPG